MDYALKRQKIHELRGVKHGLEFLQQRLTKTLDHDPSQFISYAEAVERYSTLFRDGYTGNFDPRWSATIRAEALMLAQQLQIIAAEIKLCKTDAAHLDAVELTTKINAIFPALEHLITYFT